MGAPNPAGRGLTAHHVTSCPFMLFGADASFQAGDGAGRAAQAGSGQALNAAGQPQEACAALSGAPGLDARVRW